MAADVRAFLEARPVSARAARPLYLMAKFAQRNRTAVWTAGMAALGLATALTATILRGRLAAALGVALLAVAAVLALAQARRVATARDAAPGPATTRARSSTASNASSTTLSFATVTP